MSNEKEYELIQDDVMVAATSGSNAKREIEHYATMYGQDAPVEIYEVTRVKIYPVAAPSVADVAPAGEMQMLADDYVHTIASECGMYEQHDNAKPSADTVIGFANALYDAIVSNAAIASLDKPVVAMSDLLVYEFNGSDREYFAADDVRAILAAAGPDAALVEALSMVRDYVVSMKGMGHEYQIVIDAALAAHAGQGAKT